MLPSGSLEVEPLNLMRSPERKTSAPGARRAWVRTSGLLTRPGFGEIVNRAVGAALAGMLGSSSSSTGMAEAAAGNATRARATAAMDLRMVNIAMTPFWFVVLDRGRHAEADRPREKPRVRR